MSVSTPQVAKKKRVKTPTSVAGKLKPLNGINVVLQTLTDDGVDVSEPLKDKLNDLGARVMSRVTKKTNILVWRNGNSKVFTKALETATSVVCVSPLWVETCSSENRYVSPEGYAVSPEEVYSRSPQKKVNKKAKDLPQPTDLRFSSSQTLKDIGHTIKPRKEADTSESRSEDTAKPKESGKSYSSSLVGATDQPRKRRRVGKKVVFEEPIPEDEDMEGASNKEEMEDEEDYAPPEPLPTKSSQASDSASPSPSKPSSKGGDKAVSSGATSTGQGAEGKTQAPVKRARRSPLKKGRKSAVTAVPASSKAATPAKSTRKPKKSGSSKKATPEEEKDEDMEGGDVEEGMEEGEDVEEEGYESVEEESNDTSNIVLSLSACDEAIVDTAYALIMRGQTSGRLATLSTSWDDSAITHVILGENKRTLRALFGLACGAQFVKPTWLYSSLVGEKWVAEQKHAWDDASYSKRQSRSLRFAWKAAQERKSSGQAPLLAGLKFHILEAAVKDMKVADFRKLIEAFGGQIASSRSNASHCVVNAQSDMEGEGGSGMGEGVTMEWVLNCICSQTILPIEPLPTRAASTGQRRSSTGSAAASAAGAEEEKAKPTSRPKQSRKKETTAKATGKQLRKAATAKKSPAKSKGNPGKDQVAVASASKTVAAATESKEANHKAEAETETEGSAVKEAKGKAKPAKVAPKPKQAASSLDEDLLNLELEEEAAMIQAVEAESLRASPSREDESLVFDDSLHADEDFTANDLHDKTPPTTKHKTSRTPGSTLSNTIASETPTVPFASPNGRSASDSLSLSPEQLPTSNKHSSPSSATQPRSTPQQQAAAASAATASPTSATAGGRLERKLDFATSSPSRKAGLFPARAPTKAKEGRPPQEQGSAAVASPSRLRIEKVPSEPAKEDKDKEKKQALDDADLELDLDPSLDWVDGGMGENTWFGDEGGELSDGPSLHSPEM